MLDIVVYFFCGVIVFDFGDVVGDCYYFFFDFYCSIEGFMNIFVSD